MHAIQRGVTPSVLARFLVLGLPGGVMMAADAASFDVTTVMASVLGNTPLDLKCMGSMCPNDKAAATVLMLLCFVYAVCHLTDPVCHAADPKPGPPP